MEVIYAREAPPKSWKKSVFLAGPTPRSPRVQSWRPKALWLLEKSGYDGVVFVPEDREERDYSSFDFKKQIEWEWQCLNLADCVLFWVPRDLKNLPGFTTNVEFGFWVRSGKVILGAPDTAAKMDYLRALAKSEYVPVTDNLEDAVNKVLAFVGDGYLRTGGEREVPLHIWRMPSFQSWYSAQKGAGNRLDGAKLEWVFRVGKNKDAVYAWVLHVNVYIQSENRNKTNEIVISRNDISSVVLFRKDPNSDDPLDYSVVLVKEFRSPAATPDGFIWELPGGSSWNPFEPPLEVAVKEVFEETGLKLEAARFKTHRSRQLAGTFSAHKANLFSVELTDKELEWLAGQKGIPKGLLDNPSGERTYVEIKTVKELLGWTLVDWSTLGMILQSLFYKVYP